MTNQKFSKFQAFEHKNAFGIDLIENDESVDIELTPETLKTLSGGWGDGWGGSRGRGRWMGMAVDLFGALFSALEFSLGFRRVGIGMAARNR